MSPTHPTHSARWTWRDYQITPEISMDEKLRGRIVNRNLVTRLNKLVKLQAVAILRKVGL